MTNDVRYHKLPDPGPEDTSPKIKSGSYTISFHTPVASNLEKEGKNTVINGVHPDHEETLQNSGGMRTKIGHMIHAKVLNNKNNVVTNHHIFQTSGDNPMRTVTPLGDHDANAAHNTAIIRALSQPKED